MGLAKKVRCCATTGAVQSGANVDQLLAVLKQQAVVPPRGFVDILGGTSAVSDDVAKRLARLGYTVQRYGGATRYDTALTIAHAAILLTNDRTMDPATAAYVRPFAAASTPSNPAVYAVGGGATAVTGGAMVIVPQSLTPGLTSLLNGLAPRLSQVSIFGGPAVVSGSEYGQIVTAVRGRSD